MEVISNSMSFSKKEVTVRNEMSMNITDCSQARFPFTVAVDPVLREDGTIGQELRKFEIFFRSTTCTGRPDKENLIGLAALNLEPGQKTHVLHVFLKEMTERQPPIHIFSRQVISANLFTDKNEPLTKQVHVKSENKLITSYSETELCEMFGFENDSSFVLKINLEVVFQYNVTVVKPKSKCLGYQTDDLLAELLSSLQDAKDSPDLQDFKLICDGKYFSCSKFMLMARSDVFKAMLSHSETKESQTNEAIIEGCTPEALGIFLQLLYTGQAQLPHDCLRGLFELADRYQVLSIKHAIVRDLIATVGSSNACQLAILAHLHQEKDLLQAALKAIHDNFETVEGTAAWKEIENKHTAIVSKLLLMFKGQQQNKDE